MDGQSEELNDDALLCCFMVAISGFFLLRAIPVTAENITLSTHPPHAMRLNFVMEAASLWCGVERPMLVAHVSHKSFHELMASVADVLLGPDDRERWALQHEFLVSGAGAEYVRSLQESFMEYVRSLPTGARSLAAG